MLPALLTPWYRKASGVDQAVWGEMHGPPIVWVGGLGLQPEDKIQLTVFPTVVVIYCQRRSGCAGISLALV